MSLTWQRVAGITLLAVLMQSVGLSLFVIGFFPVKPALRGVGGVESYESGCNWNGEMENMPPDRLRSLYAEKSGIPVQFDRLIFMVIDGLPAEFVIGKGRAPPPEMTREAMPYTQFLLSSGRAFGYHSRAAPPTVTMPRLKAMTSGAIAGFLDVAFNFNTQAFLDDNILGQLARVGWKMVMLGDETWLRLFPSLFMRKDGVSSFYVKDTIEVDRNVTRHVEDELISTDWDLLILHYLGLDHVGHTGGRTSSLMGPKLSELDKIIEKLHMSLVIKSNSTTRRTLLMVVSDHGMTDGGNHGGSSFEETDALAIFVPSDTAPSRDVTSVPLHSAFQVDIAPTLALLLGVPIPKNSVGVLLPQLFHSFTDEQRLRALQLNSWQLLRLLKARLPNSKCIISLCNKETHNEYLEREMGGEPMDARLCYLFTRAIFLHDSWQPQESCLDFDQCIYDKDPKLAVEAYTEFLKTASEYLARGNTEVITMYWLGMSGHFGLGNSNSLATVDVAGAYIGLSKHSTVLSGILLFIITYASPFLFLFGSLLCSSFAKGQNNTCTDKEDGNSGYFVLKSIALPCILPLALNSVVLVGFTGILFLMRNHLFVWSVFSPKYLYVCATTICVYIATSFIAITGFYVNFVMFVRSKSSLLWIHMKM